MTTPLLMVVETRPKTMKFRVMIYFKGERYSDSISQPYLGGLKTFYSGRGYI